MTIAKSCVNCAHYVHLESIFFSRHMCYQPKVIEHHSPIEGRGVVCKTARSDGKHNRFYGHCVGGALFKEKAKCSEPNSAI